MSEDVRTAGSDEMEALQLKGRKVLVLGLGLSGRAAAEKLLECGARLTLCDEADDLELREKADGLRSRGARCVLGSLGPEVLEGQELLVVSPGVPNNHFLLQEAEKRGITIWSELELAWRFVRLPTIAVTGTNGKTTTVRMIEEVLKEAGLKPLVAGNIGRPLARAVREQDGFDWLVLEVSSFQLARTERFSPRVAVILNVRDDHYDWHLDFHDYVRCKSRITMNQEPQDSVICNLDDPGSMEAARETRSRRILFSTRPDPQAAVYISGDRIVSRLALRPEMALDLVEVMPTAELPLPGRHNLENALAATAVGLAIGLDPSAIRRALSRFRGLPHRIQLVGEVAGVLFYDDSKATNPDAAICALQSFSQPVVAIMGGRNKGLGLQGLAKTLVDLEGEGRLRGVVLLGEAADELRESLEKGGLKQPARKVRTMEEAVDVAHRMASPGDVVLLTPACASFDLYSSYTERGEHFSRLVREMSEGKGDGK